MVDILRTLFERLGLPQPFRFGLLWRLKMVRFGLLVKPAAGASGEGDDDGGGDGKDGKDGDDEGDGKDGDGDDEGGDEGDGDGDEGDGSGSGSGRRTSKTAEELRRELRKSDARSKREGAKNVKKIADLEKQLKDREDVDKSEQEKAVEEAKAAGRTEAEKEHTGKLRALHLESAVTRQAAKGVPLEVTEGDETKKVTAKFADPDDALAHLERAIARKEVDADDLFDEDGKVKTESLTEALSELLEEKPHLAAKSKEEREEERQRERRPGDSDAGKGLGSGDKKLEEMSPDDHLKAVQKR